MVIVILGILAAVAIPRFFSQQTFVARGFYDQSISAVRYAQKVAIAQHRNVFVNISADVICLTYAADANCTDQTAANHVLNPADQQWFRLNAPTGVSFTSSDSFSFSPLGSPSTAATMAVGVSGDGIIRTITIERETGYVH